MSSMKEMAREYRLTAARLAAKIQEKRGAGAEEVELRPLREILRDVRETQRLLDSYYDVPRSAVSPLWAGRPGEITDGTPLEPSRAVPVEKGGARERTSFSP